MVRKIAVSLLAVLLLTGCYKKRVEELEAENSELINNAVNLREEAAVRDTLVQEVSLLIHDIYRGFGEVEAAHKVVVEEQGDGGLNRSQLWRKKGERLMNKLKAMEARLEKNRRSINYLRSLIRKNKMEVARLNTVVAQLESTNVAKQEKITGLETEITMQLEEIGRLNVQVTDQAATISENEMTIEEQKRKLNTKYYVVGTKKELLEKGIIRKKGGIFGLGAATVFTPGGAMEAFSAVQKSAATVTAAGTVREILPIRPKQSYGFEYREGEPSLIHIVDSDQFWDPSPFLVIVVK